MGSEREAGDTLEQRINNYLARFKATPDTEAPPDRHAPADRASELADALDNYLLEKAAEELKAARARLDAFQKNLGKSKIDL